MEKKKIRRIISYSLIIFLGLAATILFYFIIKNQTGTSPLTKKLFLVVRPFIIGGIIAYIMKGTCNFFERLYKKGLMKSGKRDERRANKLASVFSIITTYVIWIAAITALVALIAKPLVESVKNLIQSLVEIVPDYTTRALDFINAKLESQPQLQEMFQNAIENIYAKFETWVQTDLPNMIQDLSTKVIFGVMDIAKFLMDCGIGLVLSVLLLAGRKSLAAKAKILVKCLFKENTANAIIGEFKFADKMFSGFLEGKVIDSTIIGVLYYIALLIMGIEYAPLIAVICGVTNIIPIFGPFIGAIPSAIIIFTAEDPIKVLWFILFVCVMQFIDGYIIDPHIVGGNIKISSFSVIFAVVFFGGLWGFAGLLVGVPVFAVIYDIGKKIVVHILKKRDKMHLIDEYHEQFKKKKNPKTAKVAVAAEGDVTTETSDCESELGSETQSDADEAPSQDEEIEN